MKKNDKGDDVFFVSVKKEFVEEDIMVSTEKQCLTVMFGTNVSKNYNIEAFIWSRKTASKITKISEKILKFWEFSTE